MSISVAMAVYNGEKYLKQQLSSILEQLSDDDEIVISYDFSKDNTMNIIKSFSENDNRIKILEGPNLGAVKNFENAIKHCKNEYIFLSDQDDIWLYNKVEMVMDEFRKTGADLVLHDAIIVNDKLKSLKMSFFKKRGCTKGIFKNIIKNSYIGCCMAFKSGLKEKFLPFPKNIPMHDQWIGLVAEKCGKVSFLEEPLIKYRRHFDNVSREKHSDIITMLTWRIAIIKNLLFIKV